MTQGTDENSSGGNDLTAEIDKTMAEAEAAVQDVTDDENVVEILDDEDAEDGASAAELAELRERVSTLEGQVAATKDKWLRAVADLENYKKRTKREMDDQSLRTSKSLLTGFLPVVDNLERALEVAEPTAAGASDENAENVRNPIQGLKMVRQEFLGALSRNGIGQTFDPSLHDALQQLDSPDHAPGVIIREFEKGYKMNDRLLRPARVIVAGAGSTGAPAEDTESDAGEG